MYTAVAYLRLHGTNHQCVFCRRWPTCNRCLNVSLSSLQFSLIEKSKWKEGVLLFSTTPFLHREGQLYFHHRRNNTSNNNVRGWIKKGLGNSIFEKIITYVVMKLFHFELTHPWSRFMHQTVWKEVVLCQFPLIVFSSFHH